LHCVAAPAASRLEYELVASMVALDGEMKGLLVLTLTLTAAAAATALAYGPADVAAAVANPVWPGEPTALLLSGSVLIGAAGALRRCTF
jgi:hypothetical protein